MMWGRITRDQSTKVFNRDMNTLATNLRSHVKQHSKGASIFRFEAEWLLATDGFSAPHLGKYGYNTDRYAIRIA